MPLGWELHRHWTEKPTVRNKKRMTILGAKEATSEHVSSCYQLPAKKLSFASDDDDGNDNNDNDVDNDVAAINSLIAWPNKKTR